MQTIMQSIKASVWFPVREGTHYCIAGIPSDSSLYISLLYRYHRGSNHKLKVLSANKGGGESG